MRDICLSRGLGDVYKGQAERFGWTQRVRDVELAADGTIWVLEDPPLGRLIRFSKPLN